jgi:hypothetical protein
MIVGHVSHLPIMAFIDYLGTVEINALHVFGTAMHPWEQLAQGRCHRLWIDRRPHHFGQQGMKDQMIFMVEKYDLTSVAGQLPTQALGTFCPGKSAPHNHNACLRHTHPLPPSCRYRQHQGGGQPWTMFIPCLVITQQP